MDDGVDVGVFVKYGGKPHSVADVALVIREVLSRDLFDALERLGRGVRVIVDDDDLLSGVQKFNAGVRADETGAAGNEYCHGMYISFYNFSFGTQAKKILSTSVCGSGA